MSRDPNQALLVEPEEEEKTYEESRDFEPPIEEREEMLRVVEESEDGYQLLQRPWDENSFWQVVHCEQSGPRRVGSPNGGCLYAKDDEDRARRYFQVMSSVPRDTGTTRVPGYIAAAGQETVVEWLYAYRRYDTEELAHRTGLTEEEIEALLGAEQTDGSDI